MKRRRKRLIGAWLGGAILLACVAGYWRYRAAVTMADVLPDFTEPAAGPRGPAAPFFGFAVGHTRLPQAEAMLAELGLHCADTSMRALMRQMRQQRQREIDEKKARGENVDSTSGASALRRRSPKEANPQVRLSCDDVSSSTFSDRVRPPSLGRLLLVFDSANHPLRHISFERTFRPSAGADARDDIIAARGAMSSVLGQARPPAGADPAQPPQLAWLKPDETEWSFRDLRVRVSAINYGPRGIVVSELAEVPWPVRADAPARP